jgi:hypothetical protein
MPIDISVPQSPGWWMRRLFNGLANRRRRYRLQLLHNYHRGQAPLPQGAEAAREAFAAFQRKARSNFAELIVSAMSERMTPVGFRTAVDSDATGDAEVGNLWTRAGLDVSSADVHDLMLSLGEAYVIVGAVDDETGAPLVTSEDPRFMVSESVPGNPRRLLAAMKILHDDAVGEDRAYLYLPGEVWVATRQSSSWNLPSSLELDFPDATTAWNQLGPGPSLNFDERSWQWSQDRSGALNHTRMPVVKFTNKYSMGEYESHLDLLDRINHQILQRMVIATMQAFRQRAVKGLPLIYPENHPKAGQEIDYNKVFTADPAALWQLPAAAEMWESSINDLRPILDAVHDDLEHLASVTRTPMHMLTPSGENQSAEGASLSREGLVFKVKDRITRTSYPWAQVMSLALIHAGQSNRADMAKLQTIWAPAEHLSLAEKADAASKLAALLPRRTMLITVMGMSPGEADRTMTEIADEQVLALQVQQAMAATAAPAQASAATDQTGAGGQTQQPQVGGSPQQAAADVLTAGPGQALVRPHVRGIGQRALPAGSGGKTT